MCNPFGDSGTDTCRPLQCDDSTPRMSLQGRELPFATDPLERQVSGVESSDA